MTLAAVSKRTGMDQATLSRLENGRQPNPTVDTLWRYAGPVGRRLVLTHADAPAEDPSNGKAARSGLQIGRGQSGTSLSLPAEVPAQVVHQIQQLAHTVFTQAFVDAMRPTMALAIAVVLIAAVGALAARNAAAGGRVQTATEAQPEPASVA